MTAAPPDRRPAWDEVRERQRRASARLEAEREAAVAAAPDRPTDVWRVSGRPVETLRPHLDPTGGDRS